MAKMLAARIKEVTDTIISHNQKGFVPKQLITAQTRLTKLIQAYLDETDEDGLIIFLDMEKAFDSVSHEFLLEAMRKLGFGAEMRHWVSLMYNTEAPPTRRLMINLWTPQPTLYSQFRRRSGMPALSTVIPSYHRTFHQTHRRRRADQRHYHPTCPARHISVCR